MSEVMLSVQDLSVNYGHIEALKNVNVEVRKGQICSIIGANGAGKSTLLKAVSALVKPVGGKIVFCGEELLGSDGVRKAYPGDYAFITSNKRHSLMNIGEEKLLLMFVYAPSIIVDHWAKELEKGKKD